ncbi:hypothetical protein CEXT_773381 [Caerostris extrusa]|uniref:Uncharacterized protein n=1 Tax=Caerostris extrusa TaxID=172846 RepID=A0AAV4S2A0_CAEEX|nr:hypothetical protein CEXT_773381 [Caerostris extrusa]
MSPLTPKVVVCHHNEPDQGHLHFGSSTNITSPKTLTLNFRQPPSGSSFEVIVVEETFDGSSARDCWNQEVLTFSHWVF